MNGPTRLELAAPMIGQGILRPSELPLGNPPRTILGLCPSSARSPTQVRGFPLPQP